MDLARSVLFLPASNARAVEKARGLSCDVAVLDLEDAVAPEMKAQARQAAADALTAGGFAPAAGVRVNGFDTGDIEADISAVRHSPLIVIPKVNTPEQVHAARRMAGHDPELWIMIETARAILNLPALAEAMADTGGGGFMLGVNDLALDLGCRSEPGREALLPHLAATVAAARAHGLTVVDGVFNALDDPDGLAAECEQGRRYGYDGKSLIHPNQIAAANAAFGPTDGEIDAAHRIVEAFAAPEATDKGAIRVHGRMVERLHLHQAERLLDRASRIAERSRP